ncbi:MAG TPA: NAD(P)/FAD-dependent oxidoreductase [Desulfomonilia bacterium]
MVHYDYDVIVAGAGPGGCVAAIKLAQAGHRVALFDSSDETTLGKPIIIEAERSIFPIVGVDMPAGDMVPYHAGCLRYISPRGKEVFSIGNKENATPIGMYLDRYVRTLLEAARRSGASFFGGHRVIAPLISSGRAAGIEFESSKGKGAATARITIDSTGFNATLVRVLPQDTGFEFPDDDRHVVSAANSFNETIPSAAEEAVRSGRHGDEEVRTRLGDYGPYSTVYSFLSTRKNRAYILIGLKKALEKSITAGQAVDNFINDAGWFGRKIHGGKGYIRIRHSLDKLVADGFMAVGEAACMVFPMHGSGVASSMYAGLLAAKTASRALFSDDTTVRALWPYSAEYQTTRGRLLAAYDVTRLTIDMFKENDVADMMESGLLNKEDIVNGLLISDPLISPATLPERIMGMARHPRFIPVLAGMGMTLNSVLSHYKKYPNEYDPAAFNSWRRRKKTLFSRLQG